MTGSMDTDVDRPPPIIPIAFGRFEQWESAIAQNLAKRFKPNFVDLGSACLDEFAAVVPLSRGHYKVLARCPELRGLRYICPALDAVTKCHDKLGLTKLLIANGLGAFVPPLRSAGAPYPYIWKRRRGGWGRHCHIIDGPETERAIDPNDDEWFAQEIAIGPVEYATHILRSGNTISYVSTFAYTMADAMLVRGERSSPVEIRFVRGCAHLNLFSRILEILDYEGTACFNYKVINGRPLIFEINPRYGASLSWDVTAYVDAYLAALRHE
jgi:hypothetical protein